MTEPIPCPTCGMQWLRCTCRSDHLMEDRLEIYEQALRVIAAKPDVWQGELAQKTLDATESSR